jgi:hypothetical protein
VLPDDSLELRDMPIRKWSRFLEALHVTKELLALF